MTIAEKLTSLQDLLMAKELSREELDYHFVAYLECTGSTSDVAEHGGLFSVVFFLLIKQCQSIYTPEKKHANEVPLKIQAYILLAFSNIAQLVHSIDFEQRIKNSYAQVIWFLRELRMQSADESYLIQASALGASTAALLEVLGDISFIFDIEENGKIVFPINQLIENVISKEDFITVKLSQSKIQILQLAVRLFTAGSGKEVLDKLRTSCNLRFLDYLYADCRYLDSPDNLNFRKNRTMIFYRPHDKSVLIRTERPDYFLPGSLPTGYSSAAEETDITRTRVIGYYVTYNLELGDVVTSFAKEIYNPASTSKILSLIFDQNAYNILLDEYIIRHSDGSYSPINRWCYLDDWIVKGAGMSYASFCFREAVNEYRLCPVKQSSEYKINFVSFGLCILLLSSSNTGTDALGLDCLTDIDWYQNQVLNRWIQNENVTTDAKFRVLSELAEQLEYCQTKQALAEAEFQSRDFLPVRFDITSVYHTLFSGLSDHILLFGEVSEDEESLTILSRKTISGKQHEGELRDKRITKTYMSDRKSIIQWKAPGSQYFIFYSIADNQGIVEEQKELSILSAIESIEANCVLDESVLRKVYSHFFDIAYERIKLFKNAFEQKANDAKIKILFETQAAIRLLHNMLYYGITVDLVEPYFQILARHQIADFADIDMDSEFCCQDPNTLYIPKDYYPAHSTLADIFTEITDISKRDPSCVFQQKLRIDCNGKYIIKDHPIERIVFLTDNFTYGSATKATLAAYLGIPAKSLQMSQRRVQEARAKTQQYICGEQIVSIPSLIEANAPVSIVVHAYYGTKIGQEAIEDFLHNSGFENCDVTYSHELTHTQSEIQDELVQLNWEENAGDPRCFMFIRKFNMPKKHVFSNETMKASKLISIFIQRDEL